MKNVFQFLSKHLKRELSLECKGYLSDVVRPFRFLKNETVLSPDQVCTHLYFITTGMLLCNGPNYNGDYILCRWYMINEDVATSVISYVSGSPCNETIFAKED